jgi:hypothetical protein
MGIALSKLVQPEAGERDEVWTGRLVTVPHTVRAG